MSGAPQGIPGAAARLGFLKRSAQGSHGEQRLSPRLEPTIALYARTATRPDSCAPTRMMRSATPSPSTYRDLIDLFLTILRIVSARKDQRSPDPGSSWPTVGRCPFPARGAPRVQTSLRPRTHVRLGKRSSNPAAPRVSALERGLENPATAAETRITTQSVKRRGRPIGARGLAPALLFSFFLSALCVGCDDEAPSRTPLKESPAPAPAPSQTVGSGSSASRVEAPAASADAGASAPASASLAGTWEGRYDAKKGSVELPPKVKDKVRKKDEGKSATGPGTVSLTIDADGELRGKAKGALGELTVIGRVEGDVFRASVTPDDPYAPQAMTGILVGRVEGDVIRANLRVAGPDAVLVRESAVELRRK